jgi:hypothetical protein
MQTEQILALLVAQRNRYDAAIQALQGPSPRRGRPRGKKAPAPAPASPAPASASAPVKAPAKPKHKISAAARKAMADAAKKRWAAIKAGKAPNPFAKAKKKTAKNG